MDYIILGKEKNTIKKLLNNEYLDKMNFMLRSFEENKELLISSEDSKLLYRDFYDLSKDFELIYSGIKKQHLNRVKEKNTYKEEYGKYIDLKDQEEIIYIPISLSKLENLTNKVCLDFMVGTVRKIFSRIKGF